MQAAGVKLAKSGDPALPLTSVPKQGTDNQKYGGEHVGGSGTEFAEHGLSATFENDFPGGWRHVLRVTQDQYLSQVRRIN